MILSAATVIALYILVDFWFSTRTNDASFIDWLREDWLVVSIRSTVILGVIWWYLGTRKTVWDAMYADYSTAPDFRFASTTYPTVSGIMKVDEEEFEISTSPTEAGLVLARPSGESLFFPWLKVKEVRALNQSPDLARVSIRRRTSIPLELQIPWASEFKDTIPDDLDYYGVE